MITVQIKGLKKVQKMTAQLPASLNKEIHKISTQFMGNVQKSAKLRAPRFTGFLSNQIKVREKGNQIILDTGEAYYAYYQEFGFTSHVIPNEYIDQHVISPNVPGRFVTNPTGFIFVGKSKPFIFPALEINLSNLPNMLQKGVKKAIQKSKK